MRVILDTNVLLSAILKDASTPAAVVRLVTTKHVMLTSMETQQEFRRVLAVLAKPYFQRVVTDRIKRNIEVMFGESELIMIAEFVSVCRDPMDDKFLELAVNGKAEFIISGDNDLLSMRIYKNTRIVTPAEFLNANAN